MSIYTVTSSKSIQGVGVNQNNSFLSLTVNAYNSSYYGFNAGLNNKGVANSFLGYQSGLSNIRGSCNVFLGNNTGLTNNSGNRNLFIGAETGISNTFGNDNTFLGCANGGSNISGYANVFIGSGTGANANSSCNILIGVGTDLNFSNNAISNNPNNGNIVLGGATTFSGSSSIILGSGNCNNANNSILIGNGLTNDQDQTLNINNQVIGNASFVALSNIYGLISTGCNEIALKSAHQKMIMNEEVTSICSEPTIIIGSSNLVKIGSTVVIPGDLIVTGNTIFKNVNMVPNVTESNFMDALANIRETWGSMAGFMSGCCGNDCVPWYANSNLVTNMNSNLVYLLSLSNELPSWFFSSNADFVWTEALSSSSNVSRAELSNAITQIYQTIGSNGSGSGSSSLSSTLNSNAFSNIYTTLSNLQIKIQNTVALSNYQTFSNAIVATTLLNSNNLALLTSSTSSNTSSIQLQQNSNLANKNLITNLSNQLLSTQTSLNQNFISLSNLTNTVTSNVAKIATLSNGMNIVNLNLSNLFSSNQAVQITLSNVQTNQTNQNVTISNLNTNLGINQSSLASLSNRVDKLSTFSNAITTNITNLSNAITTNHLNLTNSINTLSNTVVNLSNQLNLSFSSFSNSSSLSNSKQFVSCNIYQTFSNQVFQTVSALQNSINSFSNGSGTTGTTSSSNISIAIYNAWSNQVASNLSIDRSLIAGLLSSQNTINSNISNISTNLSNTSTNISTNISSISNNLQLQINSLSNFTTNLNTNFTTNLAINTNNVTTLSNATRSNQLQIASLSNQLSNFASQQKTSDVGLIAAIATLSNLPAWMANSNTLASNVALLQSLPAINTQVQTLLSLSNTLKSSPWLANSNVINSEIALLSTLSNQLFRTSNLLNATDLNLYLTQANTLLGLSNTIPAWNFLLNSNALTSNVNALLSVNTKLPAWILNSNNLTSNVDALLSVNTTLPAWILNSNSLTSNVNALLKLPAINSQVATLLSITQSNTIPAWLFNSNATNQVNQDIRSLLNLSNQVPAWILNSNALKSNANTLLNLSNQVPAWIWNSNELATTVATVSNLRSANTNVTQLLALSNSIPAWLLNSNAVTSQINALQSLSNSLPPWILNSNAAQSNANALLALSNTLPTWLLNSNVAQSNINTLLNTYKTLPAYVLNSNIVNSNVNTLLSLSNQVAPWLLNSNTMCNLVTLINQLPYTLNTAQVQSNANLLLGLSNQLPAWIYNETTLTSNVATLGQLAQLCSSALPQLMMQSNLAVNSNLKFLLNLSNQLPSWMQSQTGIDLTTTSVSNMVYELPTWLQTSNGITNVSKSINTLVQQSANVEILLSLSNSLPAWLFDRQMIQNEIISIMTLSNTLPAWIGDPNIVDFLTMWRTHSNTFDLNIDQLLRSTNALLTLSNDLPAWTLSVNNLESNLASLTSEFNQFETQTLFYVTQSNLIYSNLQILSQSASNLPYWFQSCNAFLQTVEAIHDLSCLSANIDVLLGLSNSMPPWLFNSNLIERDIIALMTLSNQMPDWFWKGEYALLSNANILTGALSNLPDWARTQTQFDSNIRDFNRLSNLPSYFFDSNLFNSNLNTLLSLSNQLPSWYLNSNQLIQDLYSLSNAIPTWAYDPQNLIMYASNINQLDGQLQSIASNFGTVSNQFSNLSLIASNVNSIMYIINQSSNLPSWIYNNTTIVFSNIQQLQSLPSWMLSESNFQSNVTELRLLTSNADTFINATSNLILNLPPWLLNSNDVNTLLGFSNGIPPWFLSQCNAIFQNEGYACGSNFVNEIEDSMRIRGDLKVDGSICATAIMNTSVYETIEFQTGSNTWSIGINSNGALDFKNKTATNSNTYVRFDGSNMILNGDIIFNNNNSNHPNSLSNLLSLNGLASNLQNSSNVINNIEQLIDDFPPWFFNSNDINTLLGFSNGIPPWFLSQCNAIFQNGGCACGSNFVNEIDDSLLINGDLKVNGFICATAIANTLVYETVEFQDGSNTWSIGINSNGLGIKSESNTYFRFDGSNMFLNGDIIFANRESASNLLSLNSLASNLQISSNVVTNIENLMTEFPRWFFNSNDINILLGFSNGIPPWFLSQCNAIFQNEGCACGSNFVNEIEDSLLIRGDLKVEGSICARAILNTSVYETLEFQTGSNTWTIGLNPNGALDFTKTNTFPLGLGQSSNPQNQSFFRFDGSNMILNGDIIFASSSSNSNSNSSNNGPFSASNLLSLESLAKNLLNSSNVVTNIEQLIEDFPPWFFNSNDINTLLGFSNGIPPWFLSQCNAIFQNGGCACGSNFVNEIDDSLLINGDLKVNGFICATAIANTLVYETVQFQNGSNSWSIGIGSNGALDFSVGSSSPSSSNNQQSVVTFSGSNMILTGDVLFANSNLQQNQSNNFSSLASLNSIVQNLPSFPGWLYNSNDMQVILGLSNGIPPWFLSQCNVIFQNEGYACGSNFVNEIDDSLLINGNLKVNGSICATAIMNTSVYETLEFQTGSNTWTIGIASNGALDFRANTGSLFSVTQNQTLTVPNIQISSPSNEQIWWTQYVDASCNLIFRSGFGTMVEFSEMFVPELLNFTGKHRCLAIDQEKEKEYKEKGIEKDNVEKDNVEKDKEKNIKNHIRKKHHNKTNKDWTEHIGKIVVSTGKYVNLEGDSKIAIDEALPVVALCRRRMDPCAFGIVGGVDTDGRFRMGNLAFVREQKTGPRLIIQSHGEGAIWISNINGPLKMGDLITSAPPPLFGYGMKQIHGAKMNYTVAKITCDCDFDEHNPENRHLSFKTEMVKGRRYKFAFVGCLYSL